MKYVLVAAALAALAACGQAQEAPAPEAPPAPQSALDQLNAQSAEEQAVFAYTQLVAYQQTHPEAQPPCTSIRGSEARGTVPENVDPQSIYAPYVGGAAFAVQCGPQLTTVRAEPRERWLVVFMPSAETAAVVNCAGLNSSDLCRTRTIPTVSPEAPASATP